MLAFLKLLFGKRTVITTVPEGAIAVEITKEHHKRKGSYQSITSCLLATALNEKFPYERVRVLNYSFRVGDEAYSLKRSDNSRLKWSYWIPSFLFRPFTVIGRS